MSLPFPSLDNNPYFSAGFGLTVLGAGLALARRGAVMGMMHARKALTVTIEVTSKDRSYPWVLQWLNSQEGRTLVYTSWGTEWRQFGPARRKRPLESVVLDDGIRENIVDDVTRFINSSKWYTDRGIPYRRGYLLHGTPGSGKSSFIMALAGHLNYNICIVNLNERGLTDDRLAHSLSIVPPQSIILLEDVDAAFKTTRDANDKFGTNVTFSGLLNTLDGVVAGEERLLFMTTNHIERLDPALIRPGRVDVIHRLGPASTSQIRQLFLKFYPEAPELADPFTQAVQDQGLSMAALQGYFMVNRDRPREALAHANALVQEFKHYQGVAKGTANK